MHEIHKEERRKLAAAGQMFLDVKRRTKQAGWNAVRCPLVPCPAPSRRRTGLAGVSTRPPAGLLHPWGATSCRKAAPLMTQVEKPWPESSYCRLAGKRSSERRVALKPYVSLCATKAPDCRYGLVQAASDRHGSCQCLNRVESSHFRAKVSSTCSHIYLLALRRGGGSVAVAGRAQPHQACQDGDDEDVALAVPRRLHAVAHGDAHGRQPGGHGERRELHGHAPFGAGLACVARPLFVHRARPPGHRTGTWSLPRARLTASVCVLPPSACTCALLVRSQQVGPGRRTSTAGIERRSHSTPHSTQPMRCRGLSPAPQHGACTCAR